MLPVAWRFFLGFEQHGGPNSLPIQLEAKVSDYIGLVMKLILAFGLCFRKPVPVLTLVTWSGSSHPKAYARTAALRHRGRFFAARACPPPDPFSMMSLALPIVILYEISIWSARWVEKKRAQRDKEIDDELKGSGPT